MVLQEEVANALKEFLIWLLGLRKEFKDSFFWHLHPTEPEHDVITLSHGPQDKAHHP